MPRPRRALLDSASARSAHRRQRRILRRPAALKRCRRRSPQPLLLWLSVRYRPGGARYLLWRVVGHARAVPNPPWWGEETQGEELGHGAAVPYLSHSATSSQTDATTAPRTNFLEAPAGRARSRDDRRDAITAPSVQRTSGQREVHRRQRR